MTVAGRASLSPKRGQLGLNTLRVQYKRLQEVSVGGRVSDPAFRLLQINVNLQEMGHRFHRTHPPTPSLTTFIQLLSHITIPCPKFQHFLLHPCSRQNLELALVQCCGWAGSHLQDDAVRLVEVRSAPTGAGVFLRCWP